MSRLTGLPSAYKQMIALPPLLNIVRNVLEQNDTWAGEAGPHITDVLGADAIFQKPFDIVETDEYGIVSYKLIKYSVTDNRLEVFCLLFESKNGNPTITHSSDDGFAEHLDTVFKALPLNTMVDLYC